MEEYKNILSRDTASSDVKKNLAEVQREWHTAKLQIQGHPQNQTARLRQLITEIAPFFSAFSRRLQGTKREKLNHSKVLNDPTINTEITMEKGLTLCPVKHPCSHHPRGAWPLGQPGILSAPLFRVTVGVTSLCCILAT